MTTCAERYEAKTIACDCSESGERFSPLLTGIERGHVVATHYFALRKQKSLHDNLRRAARSEDNCLRFLRKCGRFSPLLAGIERGHVVATHYFALRNVEMSCRTPNWTDMAGCAFSPSGRLQQY
jgi:hypothetical protein